MPLIPIVGRKSLGTRLLIATLYVILCLGAVMMVYPFALMVSTATTSNADWGEFRVIPRYWVDRNDQFRKYVLDKTSFETVAFQYEQDQWYTVRDTDAKDFAWLAALPESCVKTAACDYADFLKTLNPEFKQATYVGCDKVDFSVLSRRKAYFTFLAKKYNNDIDVVNSLYGDTAGAWDELGMPRAFAGATEGYTELPRHRDWREFVASQPPEYIGLTTLDGLTFARLRELFGSIESLNLMNGTHYKRMLDIRWADLPKLPGGAEFQANLLKVDVPLAQQRLTSAAAAAYKKFCDDMGETTCTFSETAPAEGHPRRIWIQFIRSNACLPEYLVPTDPMMLWRDFVRARYVDVDKLNAAYGLKYASFDDVRLPIPQVDWLAFNRDRSSIMWRYLLGNFAMVIDFIGVHGDSLINTIILIVLTVGTALTVNPMAAYVLSRFRLRYAHHILVFLLATMAFPAEVIMIPGFLMVKSFPLGPIVIGAVALLMFALVKSLIRVRLPLFWSVLLAAVIAGSAGWFLPPMVAAKLGRADLNVSLMNTFYALILPGLASGYSIFLLKGFFDSLPPELYEAAMLDGCGELRMFWTITLPLCKPILAVIALGAFTGAYGAFMFAFLTCQDPSMWTLMVFLYQFQQDYSMPLVMASLVITAIPTLIVFIFAQSIIMRGIVIPTFK